jgi:gamma-glutamylcyclotransferase (GGCT)/AIG2-like uncharacterized protein YtfP
MTNHIVYVYGTLRPGKVADTTRIHGTIYDIGSFPGIVLDGEDRKGEVTVERITVDDDKLASLDRYEGYYADDEEHSLYIRRRFRDGWIYVWNRSIEGYPKIEGGDWLIHTEARRVNA